MDLDLSTPRVLDFTALGRVLTPCHRYQLFWPAASDFVPIAAKFDAVIVPVAAVGAEEGFRMLADADEVQNFSGHLTLPNAALTDSP